MTRQTIDLVEVDKVLKIANSLLDVAKSYAALEKYQNVIEFLKEAVDIMNRINFENKLNSNISVILNDIAISYENLGNLNESIENLKRALSFYDIDIRCFES